jgi:hypothetical protein
MKGKYADFYWSVNKTKDGYTWKIKRHWKKESEVLQTSIESEDQDERYFKTAKAAMYNAKETIRDQYVE